MPSAFRRRSTAAGLKLLYHIMSIFATIGYRKKPVSSICRLTCFLDFGGGQPLFCFSADMCGRKTPCKRKPLTSGFQGRVGGIGGSRVQSENPLDFRRAAFPPREGRLCRPSQDTEKSRYPILNIIYKQREQHRFYQQYKHRLPYRRPYLQ